METCIPPAPTTSQGQNMGPKIPKLARSPHLTELLEKPPMVTQGDGTIPRNLFPQCVGVCFSLESMSLKL